jgi:hypothetical protein
MIVKRVWKPSLVVVVVVGGGGGCFRTGNDRRSMTEM